VNFVLQKFAGESKKCKPRKRISAEKINFPDLETASPASTENKKRAPFAKTVSALLNGNQRFNLTTFTPRAGRDVRRSIGPPRSG